MLKTNLLDKLKTKCINCKNCDLNLTVTNVVFADGNPESAKAVLIGEAPGANEDKFGIPFVGRAGKLLNEFLQKSGISRENDLYIINTIKCRPPENRVPTKQEKIACRNFMLEQIKIINPKILIFCGATAFQSFCENKTPISKIRGQWIKINIDNVTFKSMAIFHPSYLLRNHSTENGSPRDLFLHDLKTIKTEINKTP